MSRVIAVSAPVGGGKTALATGIAARLDDATTVHFDHYEELTRQPLREIMAWLESGANIDAFEIPRLGEHLEALKSGRAVTDPTTRETLAPSDTIVFETPFGRRHRETGRHIDVSIWIDVPLDVALARKVREFTEDFLQVTGHDELRKCVQWLHRYLEEYLAGIGALLAMQREAVRPTADVVLDGSQDFESLVEQARKEIATGPW